MSRVFGIRRLAAVATVLVAMLLLMPTGAQAHAGHLHPASSAEMNHKASSVTPDAVSSSGMQTARYVANVEARQESSNNSGAVPCTGGCCSNMGSHCCSAFVVAANQMTPPPVTLEHPVMADLGGAGISPAALPEPPRSLN